MRKAGGSIINGSPTAGIVGYRDRAPYVASKGGLRGVGKSVAREYGEYGTRARTVCPGVVDTDMSAADTREGVLNDCAKPIPRVWRPREISKRLAFLASDASSYGTSQDFVADKGSTA